MTTRHRRRHGRAIRKMKRQGATTPQARAVLYLANRSSDDILAAVRAACDRIPATLWEEPK